MRLIIVCLVSLLLSSCANLTTKLNSLNKDVETPKGKSVLVLKNSSYTESFLVELTASGNRVLMQFDELDGKSVGSFFDEVFDLTVEPGRHTVKILCGVKGKNESNNHSVIGLDTKADKKYVFSAYIENGQCTIKYAEAKPEAKK
jgi:hypothetical protein